LLFALSTVGKSEFDIVKKSDEISQRDFIELAHCIYRWNADAKPSGWTEFKFWWGVRQGDLDLRTVIFDTALRKVVPSKDLSENDWLQTVEGFLSQAYVLKGLSRFQQREMREKMMKLAKKTYKRTPRELRP